MRDIRSFTHTLGSKSCDAMVHPHICTSFLCPIKPCSSFMLSFSSFSSTTLQLTYLFTCYYQFHCCMPYNSPFIVSVLLYNLLFSCYAFHSFIIPTVYSLVFKFLNFPAIWPNKSTDALAFFRVYYFNTVLIACSLESWLLLPYIYMYCCISST
jgi:hypothetical protein